MVHTLFCWFIVLTASLASADLPPTVYKICVLPKTTSYYSAAEICERLHSTKVQCVIGVDRLDCLVKISQNEADFAVFEAEDLLIAADDNHLSDVLITHRIHATEQKKWEFGVVAVVSNKANISQLSDLKGKRLCHPGNNPFSTNYDWSEVFSLYFENRVAPQLCDKGVSVEENRIKALTEFFGESCKAGVWAADPEVDEELKRKYKSMCGLCDVPSVCSQRDKYWGRQGALYCLSDCLGDIAWSMLKDAKLHFSKVDVSVCGDVSLLCPDGSKMPLNSTDPCVWVTRPVPVVAAKRGKAVDIQKILSQVLSMPDFPDDFIRLLESNMMIPPMTLNPPLTPNDYLARAPGFLSANSMSVCGQDDRAVSLCVATLQDKVKCEWLAAIARVYGVQPSLSCMYGADCLISVANKSADATIVNTDTFLPAVRFHNLKPLLVQMPLQLKQAKTVSAVVKANSTFKKLSDLMGKKACFPSVDGMGWTSFTMKMQKSNSFSRICPYVKAISKFFSEVCVSKPSPDVSGYSNIKICSASFPDNEFSYDEGALHEFSYDDEAIAFQCLAIGGGDVAFIQRDSIPQFLEHMKGDPEAEGLTVNSFRALCDDGSESHNCPLSWGSYSQVMVHNNILPSRDEDVRSLFSGLNNLFGHLNTPSTRTFNMFASINSLFDTTDSSIPDTIHQRLEQIEDFIKKAKLRPNNYEIAVKSMDKCSPSSANRVYLSFATLLIFTCLLFYNNNKY